MDGGAWWAAVHGVAKSGTWLSYFTFTFHFQALEKDMATHSSVLAWRIPGTGRTWLSNFTFTFHFHAMEDMATHSSVLAWRISGMGEPGGLLSVGSQIVGHDWSELTAVAAAERFEEWLKLLPHSLHLKGFSPVWILWLFAGLFYDWRPCHTHHICKVSLTYEFSDELQGVNLYWRPWHICHTYVISHLNKLSDDSWELRHD